MTFKPQDAWGELVHKDDRTSPEEYPDHCLITFEELQDFMSRSRDTLTGTVAPSLQGPVSWRWRPRGATEWIYDPTEEWRKEHEGDIESEPLYAMIEGVGYDPATSDIRWAVNVLLEKIAAKFESHETLDIWRSDAAATVRGFKHDLHTSSVSRPEHPSPVGTPNK